MGGNNQSQWRSPFGKTFERHEPERVEPPVTVEPQPDRVVALKPNTARKIQRDHRRVQELNRRAEAAARNGDTKGAYRRGREAFRLARLNADRIRGAHIEPIRSKLHLIAAAFSLDVQKYSQALELVDRAFEGNPPEEVAQDLQRLRQAAMRARIHAETGGEGDSGHRGSEGQASGSDTGEGCESGDCEASGSEPEHGE